LIVLVAALVYLGGSLLRQLGQRAADIEDAQSTPSRTK
jgi:hypothetical protein